MESGRDITEVVNELLATCCRSCTLDIVYVQWVLIQRVWRAGQGGSGDRDENTEKRSSFLCVFDFNVKNEAIENVDFKFFFLGEDALA